MVCVGPALLQMFLTHSPCLDVVWRKRNNIYQKGLKSTFFQSDKILSISPVLIWTHNGQPSLITGTYILDVWKDGGSDVGG